MSPRIGVTSSSELSWCLYFWTESSSDRSIYCRVAGVFVGAGVGAAGALNAVPAGAMSDVILPEATGLRRAAEP